MNICRHCDVVCWWGFHQKCWGRTSSHIEQFGLLGAMRIYIEQAQKNFRLWFWKAFSLFEHSTQHFWTLLTWRESSAFSSKVQRGLFGWCASLLVSFWRALHWGFEMKDPAPFHWNPRWKASMIPDRKKLAGQLYCITGEVRDEAIVYCTYVLTFSSCNHFFSVYLSCEWAHSFCEDPTLMKKLASNNNVCGFDLILYMSLSVFCHL